MSLLYRIVTDAISGEIIGDDRYSSTPSVISLSDLPDEALKKYIILRMAKPGDTIDGVGTVSMEWVSYDSGDKRTKVTYTVEA